MKKLVNGTEEKREHRCEFWMSWDDEKRDKFVKKLQRFLNNVSIIEDYDVLLNGGHVIVRTTDTTLALKAYAYGSKMMDTDEGLITRVEMTTY